MNKKEVREKLIESGFDRVVIDKAIAKTMRWMEAAYGCEDWDELQDETGNAIDVVVGYIFETEKKPDGRGTFNRGSL